MPTDLIGPDAAVPIDGPERMLVERARAVAEVLAVDAEAVDRNGVTRERVDLLAEAGLLGLTAPADLGGTAAGPQVAREVVELVAGTCGTTWFVMTQHRSPQEAAAGTANEQLRERWERPLASGRALGAVAFAHVRRPGKPTVRAERTGTGWSVTGTLDWVTSWGLADVLLLMAQTDDGRIVQFLLPAQERPGLVVVGPVALAAMGGTRTVEIRLDGLVLGDDLVADVVDRGEWLAADALKTANASPASFGLARSAVGALHDIGERRGSVEATALAAELAERVRFVRRRAYGLIGEVPAAERLDERLALRVEALDLAAGSTTALIAATAGGAMRLSSPAQRWARESLFLLVQAQTAASRRAQLQRWLDQP